MREPGAAYQDQDRESLSDLVFGLALLVGAVFLVSALPIFWVPTPAFYVRFYMWMASFLVFPLLRPARGKAPSV